MSTFDSKCKIVGVAIIPPFTGTRVMMLPLIHADPSSIPPALAHYADLFKSLCALSPQHAGEVVYLTVDEKVVDAGETHRRAGPHVDGRFGGSGGGWGGNTGGWGSPGNGMLTVSSVPGCRAWRGTFVGDVGPDGEAEHLAPQCATMEPVTFGPGEVWWVDGMCVHESLPMPRRTQRTFVRLSLPSCAPWFDGYTVNPLGVMPTGKILPRRRYMEPA